MVCAVQTADCLPVLIADTAGTAISAVHAGWRGLAAGIVQHAVASMPVPPGRLQAWIGPAIGADHFEVGEEVVAEFRNAGFPAQLLVHGHSPAGRPMLDLAGLCRWALRSVGVVQVHGGHYCSYTDQQRFFSHRRAAPCGRMASLIWRDCL